MVRRGESLGGVGWGLWWKDCRCVRGRLLLVALAAALEECGVRKNREGEDVWVMLEDSERAKW